MDQQRYLDDLKDIRDIMNRSSRFLSLSGLSGVFAGVFALGGAYLAYSTVYKSQDYLGYRQADMSTETLTTLMLIALATVALAVGVGIFLTTRKARKNNQRLWDAQTKRLIINLLIPLVTGGTMEGRAL
jgi:predicted lysophospholipase L1 biosynthesis ABC-type transport system permease subunit